MLHLHDFHHVQVRLRWCLINGQNGIDDIGRELLGKCRVELGGERRASNVEKQAAIDLLVNLEVIQELLLCQHIHSFC